MKKSVTNLVIVATVALLAVLVTSCNHNEAELPKDDAILPSVQRKLSNEQLVSLAVGRVFDGISSKSLVKGSDVSVKRFNAKASESIKYPFDIIKIFNATRYAGEVDFQFLNEICGKNEIEIFLTPFITFINEDGTDDMTSLQPFIGDVLLVFRGELGIYSCMLNSGSYNDSVVSKVFSSHKRFAENSIEKDTSRQFTNLV